MPTHQLNQPRHCPKWERCSAPVCPLDPDWQYRTLGHDDPTCFYLSESVKEGVEENFRSRGLEDLLKVISLVTPTIRTRHRRIDTALIRARQSGSRMMKLG